MPCRNEMLGFRKNQFCNRNMQKLLQVKNLNQPRLFRPTLVEQEVNIT